MKNNSYLVFALLIALCISVLSCTKTSTPTLVAKWGLKNINLHQHKNSGTDSTVTYNGGPNDYFDFRTDGRVYIKTDSLLHSDTSIYSINGSNLTVTGIQSGSTPVLLTIQNLTNSSVSIYQKTTDTSGYFEQTINLVK